jgi:ribosomal protein S27AE
VVEVAGSLEWLADIAKPPFLMHSSPMTLYRKGQLFLGWTLCVFFAWPIWMSLLLRALGTAGMIAGTAFWLGHGVIMVYAFRCPNCGLSPFLSNKGCIAISTPWPRKICGHCGRDHQEDDVR